MSNGRVLRTFGVATLVLLFAAGIALGPTRPALVVTAVLLLPGYFATLAIFGRGVALYEGLVFALLLSLALVICGGILLGVLGLGLSPVSWWAYVAVVTMVGGAAAGLRLRGDARRLLVPPPRVRDVVHVAVGLLLVSLAVNLATASAIQSRIAEDEDLPQVWLLAEESARTVTVGVENVGRAPGAYRLELLVDGVAVEVEEIVLGAEEAWERQYTIRGAADRVDVLLYPRSGAEPIRHVWRSGVR